jgi:hypothetical protein
MYYGRPSRVAEREKSVKDKIPFIHLPLDQEYNIDVC